MQDLKINIGKRVDELNQNFNSIRNLSSKKNLQILDDYKKQNEIFSMNNKVVVIIGGTGKLGLSFSETRQQ